MRKVYTYRPKLFNVLIAKFFRLNIDNYVQQRNFKIDKINKVNTIEIYSKSSFFRRLWLVISNPFRYILTGKIIY
jgi:hypothetical protein